MTTPPTADDATATTASAAATLAASSSPDVTVGTADGAAAAAASAAGTGMDVDTDPIQAATAPPTAEHIYFFLLHIRRRAADDATATAASAAATLAAPPSPDVTVGTAEGSTRRLPLPPPTLVWMLTPMLHPLPLLTTHKSPSPTATTVSWPTPAPKKRKKRYSGGAQARCVLNGPAVGDDLIPTWRRPAPRSTTRRMGRGLTGKCDLTKRFSEWTAEPNARSLSVARRHELDARTGRGGSGLRLKCCLFCSACLAVCCYCMVAVLFAL